MKKLFSVVLVLCILVTSYCFVFAEETVAELMEYNPERHSVRSLAPGKSLKITLAEGNSVESIYIFNSDMKFDVAVYYDDTIVETGNHSGKTEKFAVWGYYNYIILTARSENNGNMDFYYKADVFSFEEYEKDALTHFYVKPGESVKISNPTAENIELASEREDTFFDIILFDADGDDGWEYQNINKEVDVKSGGYCVLTASSDNISDLNLYCSIDSLKAEKSSEQALKYFNVEAGKSIRVKNTYSDSTEIFPVYEDVYYDYVVYESDGDVKNFPESNVENEDIYIPYGGWCDITAKEQNVCFYYRSNHTLNVSSKYEDTLTYVEIEPGKSIMLENNADESINVITQDKNAYYECVMYDDDGDVDEYSTKYNENDSLVVGKNQYAVITAKAENVVNAKFYYVKDLAEHSDCDEPAFSFVTIEKGESIRVSNSYNGNSVRIRKTESDINYDYAAYKADGKLSSYEWGTTDGSCYVPKGGHTIITAKEDTPITLFFPYKYVSSRAYSKKALTYVTVGAGESYTFRHNNVTGSGKSVHSVNSGEVRVEHYKADGKHYSSSSTSSAFSVSEGGYAIATVTGAEAKTFCYPYGSFNFSGNIFLYEISLDAVIPDLYVGDTYRIIPKCFGFAAKLLKLKWSSSNPSVATVDENGLVTAVGEGEYTIYCAFDDGKEINPSDASLMAMTTSQTVAKGTVYSGDETAEKFLIKYGVGGAVIDENNKVVKGFNNAAQFFTYPQGFPSYYIFSKKYAFSFGNVSRKYASIRGEGWPGVCFGMSAATMLFYKGDMKAENYRSENDSKCKYKNVSEIPINAINIKNEMILRDEIEMINALQYSSNMVHRKYKYDDIEKGIKARIEQDGCVLISIYWDSGDGYCGHGLLGYDIEKLDDGTYLVYCYDPNKPLSTSRMIEFYPDGSVMGIGKKVTHIFYVEYKDVQKAYLSDNNLLFKYAGNWLDDYEIKLFSLTEEEQNIICLKSGTKIEDSKGNSLIAGKDISNKDLGASVINSSALAGEKVIKPEYYHVTIPTGTYSVTPAEGAPLNMITNDLSTKIECSPGTKAEINLATNEVKITNESGEKASFTITTENESLAGNNIDTLILSGSFDDEFTFDSSTLKINNVSDLKVGTVTSEELSESIPDSGNTYGSYTFASRNEEGVNKLSVNGISESGVTSDISLMSVGERKVLSAPTSNYASGSYDSALVVELSSAENASIYYTLDGSEPTEENGIFYSGGIRLNNTGAIRAIAVKDGFISSEISSFEYTMPEVEMPVASLTGDEYANSQYVELFGEEGSEIYYTLDGRDPYYYGDLYTVPLCIAKDTTLKAVCVNRGVVSETFSAEYSVVHDLACEMINFPTNQNGEAISKENFAAATKLNLVIKRYDETVAEGKLVIAEYDENNSLIGINFEDISFDREENYIEVLWQTENADAHALSIMVVDKNNRLKPLMKKFEVF